MNVEDFEIKIKRYDREKSVVIMNITLYNELEIRGYVAKYTTTKHSPVFPVWIISPPSVRGRNGNYFWIAEVKNRTLWDALQKEMIRLAKEHTDT